MKNHIPHHGGLFHSDVAGRTDKLHISVEPDSYIIPSDVVGALGENNTLAGGKVLDKMFGEGHGFNKPHGKMKAFARGGVAKHIPIIVAGGEYHLTPIQVAKAGGGSVKSGHSVLDHFVKHVREKNIKTLKNLEPPKK